MNFWADKAFLERGPYPLNLFIDLVDSQQAQVTGILNGHLPTDVFLFQEPPKQPLCPCQSVVILIVAPKSKRRPD